MDALKWSETIFNRLLPLILVYQFPSVEMHRCQLAIIGFRDVNVKRLALVDECTAIGRHLNDHSLGNFPDGLVQSFELGWDSINVLRIN